MQSITVVPDSGVPVQEGNLALGISFIGARPFGFMYGGSFTPPLSVDAYDGFVSASHTFGLYALGFFALDPVFFDIDTSPGGIDELSRQHFAGLDVGIVRRLPRRE